MQDGGFAESCFSKSACSAGPCDVLQNKHDISKGE